jgi:hypothetical protein
MGAEPYRLHFAQERKGTADELLLLRLLGATGCKLLQALRDGNYTAFRHLLMKRALNPRSH